MEFNVSSELGYKVNADTVFVFSIQALSTPYQKIVHEKLMITPEIPYEEFSPAVGEARFIRLKAKENTSLTIQYEALVDVNHIVVDVEKLPQATTDYETINPEYLPFVYPSRYIESDELVAFAQREFNYLKNTYDQVMAISKWIYYGVDYISGSTDGNTSAADTVIERAGVCRDFSHLGIALCRALDIPARYFTGYAHELNPPDFHACFEAYVDGYWLFFDPTRLAPVNGMVKIANGRDATDAAVASIYGDAESTVVNVSCAAADKKFKADNNHENNKQALAYQAAK